MRDDGVREREKAWRSEGVRDSKHTHTHTNIFTFHGQFGFSVHSPISSFVVLPPLLLPTGL